MDKHRIVKVVYPNRDEVVPMYANTTTVTFNPFEFSIEFAHIDGISASAKLQAGAKEIPARSLAKIVLSHQAMLEFFGKINQVVEQFQKQLPKTEDEK